MRIRPATMADADNLLKWKNQVETRRFAIAHKQKIRKSDHHKWLRTHLKGIWIIEEKGMIRIERNQVAIGVDRKHYGKGISTRALNHFKRKGMTAKIVDGNIASMRLFIKCGFKPIAYKKGYYIYAY